MEKQKQNENLNDGKIIRYSPPENWILYDAVGLTNALVNAKSTILSLRTLPYQKQWVERLQQMELKREIAGTSRIEGADFTDRELDDALNETHEQLITRSQKQARAAVSTYRWIGRIPDDVPVNRELICEIHKRLVLGADDDHCPPGVLRKRDENVSFGLPRHGGVEGGEKTNKAFSAFVDAINGEFKAHDPLIQAMAVHYHFAAMHPFLDGNGRTARALEALMLQRAGLRDTAFVAMSNYYYDEKPGYLKALAETRQRGHNLTSFLIFALKGVEIQGGRLLNEIFAETQREVFRNLMYSLFNRLKSTKKRVIGERQVQILELLLDSSPIKWEDLLKRTSHLYARLSNPRLAAVRDVNNLSGLGAVEVYSGDREEILIAIRLEWPTEITETEFFERIKKLPKGKTYPILR